MLQPLLATLAVGRLEVVLKPEVTEPSRSSVSGPASSSTSLAEADVDVAREQRPQSVLPVLAGEVVLHVWSHVPLAQSQATQAQPRAGLGAAKSKQKVLTGLLTSEPGGWPGPSSRQAKQRVHS